MLMLLTNTIKILGSAFDAALLLSVVIVITSFIMIVPWHKKNTNKNINNS